MNENTTGIEVRRNDDGTLDEVVATGCDFHLEQMDQGHWWMVISKGGRVVHINLATARGAEIKAQANG